MNVNEILERTSDISKGNGIVQFSVDGKLAPAFSVLDCLLHATRLMYAKSSIVRNGYSCLGAFGSLCVCVCGHLTADRFGHFCNKYTHRAAVHSTSVVVVDLCRLASVPTVVIAAVIVIFAIVVVTPSSTLPSPPPRRCHCHRFCSYFRGTSHTQKHTKHIIVICDTLNGQSI